MPRSSLLHSCVCVGLLTGLTFGQETPPPNPQQSQAAIDDPYDWHAAHTLTVEGQGWSKDLASPFDRLPAKAEQAVRKIVWDLSRHATGICVRFRSDAKEMKVRWELSLEALAMPHMAACAVSGLDLYTVHDGKLRWLETCMAKQFPVNDAWLFRNRDGEMHEYPLSLPLFNGVKRLELGVPAGASISPYPRATPRKPIVFYGTSITHGACASRAGMTHVAILGRRLDAPIINLGFSGNGRIEAEVGELLAEVDASVYVIDCLPNVNAEAVAQRMQPFVRALRKARPDTPIVIVEDRRYPDGYAYRERWRHNDKNAQACREAFDALRASGLTKLFYVEGRSLLGEDGEDTVDGSHPSDLGFWRQAAAIEPALRAALKAL